MDLQGSNQSATAKILNSEKGFAAIIFVGILPALLAGLLFLLFSQYYLKNWMQSLHTCRTELLETQADVAKDLEKLMALNPKAKFLRQAILTTQMAMAAAAAAQNYALAAQLHRYLMELQRAQRALDQIQKGLILKAEARMWAGTQKVVRRLKDQDRWNQRRMPSMMSFRIRPQMSLPKQLAVKPDKPDVAPVYELKNSFTDEQALNVSWISEMKTGSRETFEWIRHQHRKNQSCSASLKSQGKSFPQVLTEAKPW